MAVRLFIYRLGELIGNPGICDVAAEEDEPEKRLACWWLNCSGIPARYGWCLRYAYIVRYSGFANPVRDSVRWPFTARNRNFHSPLES